MKNFEWYDITCALTHDLGTCERCKKCGDYPRVRFEMADYVKRLDNALDKASEKLGNEFGCEHDSWKKILLKESDEPK